MGWIAILIFVFALVVAIKVGRRLLLGAGSNAWRPAIEAAAASLSGRPAITAGEAELRAEAEGVTVTLKVQGDLLKAEAPLYPGARDSRFYLSSGARSPEDLGHIPELALPPAFSLDPPVILRADDAPFAVSYAEQSALALAKLRQEARATGVELLVRGGTLRLVLHRARAAPEVIEATVRVAAAQVGRWGGDRVAAERSTKQLPARREAVERCALCGGERRPGVAWVRCSTCRAPHHAECFGTSQRCAKDGCGSVRSEPI